MQNDDFDKNCNNYESRSIDLIPNRDSNLAVIINDIAGINDEK